MPALAPLPPEVERAALLELDAWCATRGLVPASVRRVELLAERARELAHRRYVRRRFEQTVHFLLDVHRSSCRDEVGYPREYADGRPKLRPRGKSVAKRLAWACEHTDRPNYSHGRCRTCTKRDARRAAGITERRQGRDVEQQRARRRDYMRAKRAAERAAQPGSR